MVKFDAANKHGLPNCITCWIYGGRVEGWMVCATRAFSNTIVNKLNLYAKVY